MITEISLQPPHPWFITPETKERILEYDINILPSHYKKLKQCLISKEFNQMHYVLIEALHHGASSILTRYSQFIGNEDLDAFYNLTFIVTKLNLREYDDLLFDTSELCNISSDLSLINYNLQSFSTILNTIKKRIKNPQYFFKMQEDLIKDVIEFCDIAFAIYNLDNNKKNIKFNLLTPWNTENNDIVKAINTVFKMIECLDTRSVLIKVPFAFWITIKNTMKPQTLVAVVNEKTNLNNLESYLNDKKIKRYADSFIIVVEDKSTYDNISQKIKDIEEHLGFCSYTFFKDDIIKIFDSNNKTSTFDKLLNSVFY